jgi:hypothetical protein
MQEVLVVYQEVNLQNDKDKEADTTIHPRIITVSVDEKPGVQAIDTVAPDLPPKPGSYPSTGRDYGFVTK